VLKGFISISFSQRPFDKLRAAGNTKDDLLNNYLTISLTNLHFFAYHGLYAEERKTGNDFTIDLSVSYQPKAGTITDISDTIDYSRLYALVKAEMQKPRDLLETFVMEMTEIIHSSFPGIKKVDIGITKMHLPVAGFIGQAVVRYAKDY
jgi:dihydroneopterin aldolase